ncbi:MAG TPA: rhombosortase [Steroidobacteraceae bacterium]|nr:rhombosortase [Steroidobacteraceae bacterium]
MSDAVRGPEALPTAVSAIQGGWLVGLLGATVVLLSLTGESGRELLRYERVAILHDHQYWRLLTGHLVHGSVQHLLLNAVGLGLIAALFPREFSLRGWLLVLASSIVTIDLGFVLLEPQLQWYVGLSGVLHGALAAGAIGWWRHESRALALALTAILVGKLAWEQWHGALPLSGDLPVVVDAHLYGAIGGALAGAFLCLRSRDWPLGRSSL